MKFEAYKIIEFARDTDLAASAANVLNPPLLVGSAEGVCITPKACQRSSVLHETYRKTV